MILIYNNDFEVCLTNNWPNLALSTMEVDYISANQKREVQFKTKKIRF